jgi:hypothetical protein
MKRIKQLSFVMGVVLFFSSCAMTSAPLTGVWYTDVKAPLAVTSNANASKVGTAEAVSYLGAIAIGDASIEAAIKSAGISKIHHVDQHYTSILGLFAKYQVYVYGE